MHPSCWKRPSRSSSTQSSLSLPAGEAADDDDGPRHVAAGRGNPLPFALLGRLPVATPDASVAGEENILQGVGGVRKGGEEDLHRRAPGRQAVDRLHSQPVRSQIVIPVLFQGIHTVPVKDIVDVAADQRLVLVCYHGPCSSRRVSLLQSHYH